MIAPHGRFFASATSLRAAQVITNFAIRDKTDRICDRADSLTRKFG